MARARRFDSDWRCFGRQSERCAAQRGSRPDGGTPAIELEWYKAAAVHVHVSGCENHETPQSILALMKKANLNIASILIWGGQNSYGPSLELDWMNFRGQQDDPLSEPNHILHWDLEISELRGDWGGHLVLLNLADKNLFKGGKANYPGKEYLLRGNGSRERQRARPSRRARRSHPDRSVPPVALFGSEVSTGRSAEGSFWMVWSTRHREKSRWKNPAARCCLRTHSCALVPQKQQKK